MSLRPTHIYRAFTRVVLLAIALSLVVFVGIQYARNGKTAGISLTRAPSLQQCATDSAVICWKTKVTTGSVLQYSADSSFNLQISEPAATTFHTVTLRGLRADQTYHYRIVMNGRTLYASAFRAYPKPGDSRYDHFSFWAIGDGGSTGSHQMAVRDRIQALVDKGQVDFGLYLGDIVYPRGAENGQDARYFVPYQSIIDKQTCWTVLGNHDLREQEGLAYFQNRALPIPDTLADPQHGERWYAFSFGSALLIALDSSDPVNPIQTQFLRWVLEHHRDKLWKFAFFHKSPYATPYLNEEPCSHTSNMQVRENWSPLFEEYEVDAVFCGHSHTYQRSQLRKDFFPDKKGVYYLISGGGGSKETDHHVNLSDSECNHPSLTQAAVKSSTYHFLQVTIASLTFSIRAIDETGQIFDTFTFTKSHPVSAPHHRKG